MDARMEEKAFLAIHAYNQQVEVWNSLRAEFTAAYLLFQPLLELNILPMETRTQMLGTMNKLITVARGLLRLQKDIFDLIGQPITWNLPGCKQDGERANPIDADALSDEEVLSIVAFPTIESRPKAKA